MFQQSITAALLLILQFGVNTAIADSKPGRAIGEETRNWLELQSSGAIASKARQTVSGPVADAIYQRYVDSFKHPIPEFYSSQQRGKSGGSSR